MNIWISSAADARTAAIIFSIRCCVWIIPRWSASPVSFAASRSPRRPYFANIAAVGWMRWIACRTRWIWMIWCDRNPRTTNPIPTAASFLQGSPNEALSCFQLKPLDASRRQFQHTPCLEKIRAHTKRRHLLAQTDDASVFCRETPHRWETP
ncbi:MAG: hypothetical protein KatS3mg104_3241 [Phycisphaerae bacterium]|nr:MAG: hypothetical protein KatS3mg104_3241 [Phycisphaerae bacterium]